MPAAAAVARRDRQRQNSSDPHPIDPNGHRSKVVPTESEEFCRLLHKRPIPDFAHNFVVHVPRFGPDRVHWGHGRERCRGRRCRPERDLPHARRARAPGAAPPRGCAPRRSRPADSTRQRQTRRDGLPGAARRGGQTPRTVGLCVSPGPPRRVHRRSARADARPDRGGIEPSASPRPVRGGALATLGVGSKLPRRTPHRRTRSSVPVSVTADRDRHARQRMASRVRERGGHRRGLSASAATLRGPAALSGASGRVRLGVDRPRDAARARRAGRGPGGHSRRRPSGSRGRRVAHRRMRQPCPSQRLGTAGPRPSSRRRRRRVGVHDDPSDRRGHLPCPPTPSKTTCAEFCSTAASAELLRIGRHVPGRAPKQSNRRRIGGVLPQHRPEQPRLRRRSPRRSAR